jgi:hypothetical protein
LLRKVLPDIQSLEISGNSEKPLQVQIVRFSDGLVVDADHQTVPPTFSSADGADISSAPKDAESHTNPDVDDVSNIYDPYSGPSPDAVPDAIEHNARLIEDEPSRPRKRRKS